MSIKMARKIAILLIASVLLICGIGLVSASPVIISWGNNYTNDNSTSITIPTGETVVFNVAANETITTWTWKLDGIDQTNNIISTNNTTSFEHAFPLYGTYNVNVSGSNENGITQTVTWNVIVELTITDDLGNTWTISKQPERIISLAPSNTEKLFAVGAGDRVVGVTDFCDYPLEVRGIDSVGGFFNPCVERIVNLTPDLILAAHGNPTEVINHLITLNYTVVALHPKSLPEILDNINLVGKITQEGGNASVITTDMQTRIDAVTSITTHYTEAQRLRVLYVVWHDPMWVAGSGTFAHDLIQKAGGINIAEQLDGWGVMSLESILVNNPEVIICSGMGGGSEIIKGHLINNPVIQQTDAYGYGRIYAIVDPNIIERHGPRIVYGLEEFYDVIRSTPPITTIASSAGTSTFATSTVISGVVRDSDPKSLYVQGATITPAADGSYSREVSLSIGYNTFVVNATDDAGNSVERSITVKRLLAGTVPPIEPVPEPEPEPEPEPVVPPVEPEPEPEPEPPIPGFGATFAIFGLLAVAYLFRRRLRRGEE